MYVSADCAMQFHACVCISAMLVQYNPMLAYVCLSHLHNFAQFSGQNVLRDDYSPGLLPGRCDPYLMEEHDPQAFQVPALLTAHRVRFQ